MQSAVSRLDWADDRSSRAPARFAALLKGSLRAHTLLLAIPLAFGLASYLTTGGLEQSHDMDFGLFAISFIGVMMPILLLAVVTVRFIRLVVHVRPERPLLALIKDVGAFLACPRRLANGLPMVVALFVFMQAFSHIKINIPNFQPFVWDETFMELDRWLHFGYHPWELLQPLLGYPLVTLVINLVYNIWFMVMWMVWVWMAFDTRSTVLRTQFFLAFMLCWIVGGSLLAVLLSSAGPCYYSLLGLAPDPFAPLMAYLHETHQQYPLFAIDTQATLWDAYKGEQTVVAGVSAMPSMHNATAVLFALLGWRKGRTLGILLTVFALFILIGSVHLGWHYAIDGYLGALIAVVAWWIAGYIARRYERLPCPRLHRLAMARAARA